MHLVKFPHGIYLEKEVKVYIYVNASMKWSEEKNEFANGYFLLHVFPKRVFFDRK